MNLAFQIGRRQSHNALEKPANAVGRIRLIHFIPVVLHEGPGLVPPVHGHEKRSNDGRGVLGAKRSIQSAGQGAVHQSRRLKRGQGLQEALFYLGCGGLAEALEEIIGKVDNESILERIFSNFCIGK